ncbi:MAG: guanylate kinase [Bacteroidetes bacterium]|nr:guanylate kinase [Bacteroidota bacterium]
MEIKGGKCVVFSAPSGAGKTTIVHRLIEKIPSLSFSISACSREARPNEKNGVDYYFLSIDEFKSKIKNNEFIEWEEVYLNNFYGTLSYEIEKIWNENQNVIFDVDVVGGINLKKYFGKKALSIFVKPPSIKILEERLRARKTESEEKIKIRIQKATDEMRRAKEFDYILENNDLNLAVKEIQEVVLKFLASK